MFGEAFLSLEVVRTYLCSCKINIVSLRRTEDLERERATPSSASVEGALFVPHTQPTNQTSPLNYFKK